MNPFDPNSAPSANSAVNTRVGHGFDLHRLELGRDLVVGGVKLEHDRGCAAHSDGDVLFHAVTDAVLGALGLDDIGQLFPDSDPKWDGADSAIFLREAYMRMFAEGFAVGNLDCTVILERPKLGPHKPAIKARLAELLGCDVSQVNLKAKTHEGVDALGENRAIACHAVVLLVGAID
jgi:2-C-methyl-D-erythritol 2,4-cyclodiphosphate synthase